VLSRYVAGGGPRGAADPESRGDALVCRLLHERVEPRAVEVRLTYAGYCRPAVALSLIAWARHHVRPEDLH